MSDICFMSATQTVKKIREGELSPEEVTDAYLERIEKYDGEVNAYITLTEEDARQKSRELEPEGKLSGVPIGLKDLSYMKEGVRHTFGSKIFENFVAPRTSVSVERLENAGAVSLGKTNTPEFGHKGQTDNLITDATGSPFDTSKTSGGSSGGSAAAVGAGLACIGMGSDSGGSIRIPASACGVYGLKPSLGRVPNDSRPNVFGRDSLHPSLGPITRTVEDAALVMEVVGGHHPKDPYSVPDNPNYLDAIEEGIEGWDIAYSPDFDTFEVDEDVEEVVRNAVEGFEEAGANVEEVEICHGFDHETLRDVIVTVFGTEVLAGLETIKHEFGMDVVEDYRDMLSPSLRERLEFVEDADLMDYKMTEIERTKLYDGVQSVLDEYDVLVTPTLAVPPFDKEKDGVEEINGKEVDPKSDWMLTWPFNMTGHPAASIPAGFLEGLPIGMQIVGPMYGEKDVLTASAAFEEEEPWQEKYEEIEF